MASPLAALKGLNQQVEQAGNEAVGNAKAISSKRAMVKEYTDSLAPKAPSVGMSADKPAKSDLVKASAKYGDRPGEQRIDTAGMTKPLGSFKKGGKVKKTGVYKLHKGEEVANAKQTAKMDKKGGLAKMLAGDTDKDGK